MVLYSGFAELDIDLPGLSTNFNLENVDASDSIADPEHFKRAEVFLIGPRCDNPVKLIQRISGHDKHISILILTFPHSFRQIKQLIQFSAFVGKNTVVVSMGPELDLIAVIRNAATRTRQKRKFAQLQLTETSIAPGERIKVAQMGSFLEFAPIGAILVDDADRVVNYNQEAKKIFTSLGNLMEDLCSLFNLNAAKEIKAFLHGTHKPDTRKELRVNGKILELSSTIVFNEEGIPHSLLLFNDITNQRLEGERINSILESLPQMAWTTNSSGAITYFTRGWYFYTGQTNEEALGNGWLEVVKEEDKQRLSDQWEHSVITSTPFQQAARYRNSHGDYRWHLARALAIRNAEGQITMWVGTCTDIHDQILLTEELERKVKERTHSLELTNAELEQFAHVSSHDLQEPLRKIRTFSELLKERVYDGMDELTKRYMDKISSTAERMSTSLKALLNYTRLANKEKYGEVDLAAIVDMVLLDLELLITQKEARVIVENLPVIEAVPIQMQQLFYNLVNNSLKFARLDLNPEIRISSKKLADDPQAINPALNRFMEYYEITVQDNGIGFDQQNAEKIFTIFQRLHARHEYEGTGIGLSLVKKVVNNHQGIVKAFSNPGEGTRFQIILPAKQKHNLQM